MVYQHPIVNIHHRLRRLTAAHYNNLSEYIATTPASLGRTRGSQTWTLNLNKASAGTAEVHTCSAGPPDVHHLSHGYSIAST